MTETAQLALDDCRYEVLPFASAETEAKAVRDPLTLTVTCSPKHGNDRTVEVAARLREMGHTVVVHLAARMVRSTEHLTALLTDLQTAGIQDVFVVGGDQIEPLGPYPTAFELIEALRLHPSGPVRIGITSYPEGHPKISDEVLFDDLRRKAPMADYLTTQMCFDMDVVAVWLERIRTSGISIPAYLGVPGRVDRARLLEISVRVGVGKSVAYVRKQHGIARLARRRSAITSPLLRDASALVGGPLGVTGLHLFTFNNLGETVRSVELHHLTRSHQPHEQTRP